MTDIRIFLKTGLEALAYIIKDGDRHTNGYNDKTRK